MYFIVSARADGSGVFLNLGAHAARDCFFFVVRGAVCTAAVARTAVNIRGQLATAAVSPGVSTLLRGFWARACEEVPFR